jgi:hypothetical protein
MRKSEMKPRKGHDSSAPHKVRDHLLWAADASCAYVAARLASAGQASAVEDPRKSPWARVGAGEMAWVMDSP